MFYYCACLGLLHEVIFSLCCFHQDPEQLFQACKQGDLKVVHRFLAAGVDVEIKDAVRLKFVGTVFLFCVG